MSRFLTTDSEIRDLLISSKRIAVVGVSERAGRPSRHVAGYLVNAGYEVIPVNPNLDNWAGLKAYPSLRDVPGQVDIVDVFRRPEHVAQVVEDAIASGAGAVWMQLGIVNEDAARTAIAAGLPVVMDACALVEHRRLVANGEDSR